MDDGIITKEAAIEIVKQYARRVYEEIDKDAKVYLFGSIVRGEAHLCSDIDVAVVSKEFGRHSINERVELMRIGDDINLNIEPHPISLKRWNKDDSLVGSRVKFEGVLV
ncbi:MAG: nucleotidyltransferase domain-containing protein [Clostridiales bacterium]|nr:nucleotidyltransferase domain-containing protein [Clostridiales bacterium]